jgi:hypothetical protein
MGGPIDGLATLSGKTFLATRWYYRVEALPDLPGAYAVQPADRLAQIVEAFGAWLGFVLVF